MSYFPSRRVPSLTALLLCLAIGAPQASAQDAAPVPPPNAASSSTEKETRLCAIAGTVTSAATGEPLKKVAVDLSPESLRNDNTTRNALTDASGRFSIDRIVPGRYRLSVNREGYLAQSYGEENGDESGAVLSLAAGQKMTDLIFRLQKTAVITGRVLDEDGQPFVRAAVEVLQKHKTNGTVKFYPVGSESTDDQGNYRVFDLRPGRYFIRVRPQGRGGSFHMSGEDDGDEEDASPPKLEYSDTYYPGTPDSMRASAIDVGPGDEIPRIDFFISPQEPMKTYRVRGRVTNAIGGDSQLFMSVLLMPRGSDDLNSSRFVAQPNQKTGNFEITRVPPGSYTVMAQSFGNSRQRSVTQDIQVVNTDVDSVSLVLTRGADVSGRVIFEGQGAATSAPVAVALETRHPESTFSPQSRAVPKPDGSFTLSEVGDGSYSIQVYSNCHECYLRSASANGVDLLAQGLTVSSGGAPNSIDLVYSSNTGKAAGIVTGADDLPVPGAHVALVEDKGPREEDRDSAEWAITDQYGKFEMIGIPPGKYKALAWSKTDSDSYSDPDFVRPYLEHAESVEISAGSAASINLKLTVVKESDKAN